MVRFCLGEYTCSFDNFLKPLSFRKKIHLINFRNKLWAGFLVNTVGYGIHGYRIGETESKMNPRGNNN